MRILTGFIVALTSVAGLVRATQTSSGGSNNLTGLYDLVKRRIPSHSNSFNFTLTPAGNGTLDSFTLSDSVGASGQSAMIDIECTSVSACARGLYTYLTEYGGVDIWWTGSRLDELPSQLPSVGQPVTGSSIVKYRYFFNTVTFSYATVFYSFQDWEFLLDWMALRGVNLPLAWVGYEYTLIQVFRETGLNDSAIFDFLSGPAFQSWNRFGNIQGSWGGELPMQWVNDQFALQKQIIPRMIELGMTPVLPSFAGFVPPALATLYPNASIVIGGDWDFWPTNSDDSFLEPFDPLFTTLQKSFIQKQTAAYGNVTHIYTLDQYNENNPYTNNATYLQTIAANTFASLRAADPEAIWMMQGWLFYSAEAFWTPELVQSFLGGVPGNDSMIILDLYSEARPQWQRLDSYYGKQWVWCQVHDFGGNMGMQGDFVNITAAPLAALSSPGSTMVGMGLTPEGLEGNEIVYNVLLDQAWSSSVINRTSYVSSWVSRRYNVPQLPAAAANAWQLLGSTVYSNDNPLTPAAIKSIFELSPALSGLVNRTIFQPTLVPYDTNTTIVPALEMLLQAAQASSALAWIPEFRYDVVDVTRQLLANRFIDLYQTLVDTFSSANSSASAVQAAGQPLLELLSDVDNILASDPHFLLSNWLNAAVSWSANNATYAAYLEYNARNQITLWGADGQISDYASKQWAGLISGYYAPRWDAFIGYLVDCKQNGTAYNDTTVTNMMISIGKEWDLQTGLPEQGVPGDSLAIAEALAAKYGA